MSNKKGIARFLPDMPDISQIQEIAQKIAGFIDQSRERIETIIKNQHITYRDMKALNEKMDMFLKLHGLEYTQPPLPALVTQEQPKHDNRDAA